MAPMDRRTVLVEFGPIVGPAQLVLDHVFPVLSCA